MLYWLMSFFLGAVAVLQGGLNRQITKDWGLATAIFLNSALLLLITFCFALVCHFYPQFFPDSFPPKFGSSSWRWWFVLPALCGFTLIAGIPFAIPKLGAAGVFLCIMLGQVTFSMIWDLKVEQIPLEPKRLIGISLAALGLIITYWKSPA